MKNNYNCSDMHSVQSTSTFNLEKSQDHNPIDFINKCINFMINNDPSIDI